MISGEFISRVNGNVFYIAVYFFVASQWIRLSNLFLVCCVVQEKPFRMVYKLLLIE